MSIVPKDIATYLRQFAPLLEDRIADFLKAQKAEAEIAQREGERFQARHKAAENREKRLKQILVWFMLTRNLQKLRGDLNTICLQANSAPSLVINETAHIPASFYRARIEINWPEWVEVLEALPQGPLRDRLANGEGKFVQKELQRGIPSSTVVIENWFRLRINELHRSSRRLICSAPG